MIGFIQLFLLMFALVFFILAGVGVPEAPRFRWLGWGLAFVTAAEILARIPK